MENVVESNQLKTNVPRIVRTTKKLQHLQLKKTQSSMKMKAKKRRKMKKSSFKQVGQMK